MAQRQRPISPRANTGVLSKVLRFLGIVALLLLAVIVYTMIKGELRLPFGGGVVFAFDRPEKKEVPAAQSVPAGMVAVVACPRALPAYTKLTRDHFLVSNGPDRYPTIFTMFAPKKMVEGLFTEDDVRNLIGRVLKRPKAAEYAFSEADFLPKGTRPGPSAGIPLGYRAVWINLKDVHGLTDARAGDRVDLVAAQTMESRPPLGTGLLKNFADPVMRGRLQRAANAPKRNAEARSWVIAHEALVVTPARRREIITDTPKKGQPPAMVEEAFIAMKPEDVARFSQALTQEVTMVAAPRSGQPGGEETKIEDVTPPDPAAEVRRLLVGDSDNPIFGTVEVISGEERSTVTVPRSKDGSGR